jgi:hypothetical protein
MLQLMGSRRAVSDRFYRCVYGQLIGGPVPPSLLFWLHSRTDKLLVKVPPAMLLKIRLHWLHPVLQDAEAC